MNYGKFKKISIIPIVSLIRAVFEGAVGCYRSLNPRIPQGFRGGSRIIYVGGSKTRPYFNLPMALYAKKTGSMRNGKGIICRRFLAFVFGRKLRRLIFKTAVFTAVLVFAFSPFGNLINQYAEQNLPKFVTKQITRTVPIVRTANAATAGPLGAGADASSTTNCADNMVWTDAATETNANDSTYFQYTGTQFDSTDISDAVNINTFGFSLGAGVTSIDGITVEIINWTAVAGADYADVYLTTATATRRGEDHATGSVPTSDPNTTFATFGGTTDDWYAGGSWTQAEIEAAGFGVEICYTSTGTDTQVYLDYVQITVTYTAVATITVSGTCKQANQTDNCTDGGANHKVRVAVNGNLQSQVDDAVDDSWSISGVTQPGSGQIVTVFIEGETASSSQAVAVTKWTSGNITGVELIEGHLSIGSDQRNTITNANLGDYDSSISSKRTFHDVNGTILTVDADAKVNGEELYIKGGNTFQPNSSNGDTINTHDIEINGTFDLDRNVITASGSWDNNGLFIANTGSVSFTGIGAETISNVASVGYGSHFYHLKIKSPGGTGTVTLNDVDVVASGQVKIEAGDTLSLSSGRKLTHTGSTLVLNGTIGGSSGRFVYRSTTAFPTSGTVSSILVFDPQDGNQTMSQRTYGGQVEITNNSTTTGRTVIMGAGSPYTFSNNLYVVASTSQNIILDGATNDPAVVDIAGDLDFTGTGAGGETITSGAGNWQAAGNVNFTDGTFTTESGNTLTMDGTGTLTSNAQTLQNLEINSSGTVTLAAATHTVAGDLTLSGLGIPVVTGSTITMTGTANTINGGSKTLNNLTIDPSSAGTITMQTSDLTVSGTLTVAANDKFKIESGRTLILSGTGTPLSVSGTFEPDDGSTVQYTGSTATVTATTFGGLTLGGTGAYALSSGNTTIKGDLNITSVATVASSSGTILFRKGTTQTINDANGGASNLGEISVQASSSGDPTLLTLSSNVKIASATVDLSQTLDLNGTNTLIIQGSDSGGGKVFNINGTFTASTGIVQYTGGSATVAVPSSVYNNLTLGGTGTYTLPASNLTLRGNLAVASGATVTKSATNVLIFAKGGGGSQSVTDSNGTKQDLGEIQVSANGGNTTLTLGSPVKISSVSIDTSQTLDANGSNTIELTGNDGVFNNNGIFAPRTGTVQYTGSSADIGASKYGNLTIGGSGTYRGPSSGVTTILGDLGITSGATYASGSATLFFRKGGTQSVTDSNTVKQNFGEIAVQASTSGNTTLTLGGSVKIASATIDASQILDANGSNTLTITNADSGGGAPLTASGSFGTFTPSTGTVVFTGNGATSIPTLDYYSLKVQPSANSATHTFLSGTASVSKTFTVGNGTNTGAVATLDTNNSGLDTASVSISANTTLVADDSSEFTVARNFMNNGAFTHSSGTVTFGAGTGTASVSGTGTMTFNNFTVATPDKKIKFQAGKIFTFAGTFSVAGLSGSTVKIESTASGSQWLAHFNSAQSGVTYATITDSGCDAGTANVTLGATSVNGGNNANCWSFPGPAENENTVKHGTGGGVSEGGGSGGGTVQLGGQDQGTGSGGSEGGESGGGTPEPPPPGGGNQGTGGEASPVLFSWWSWLSRIMYR